MAALILLSSMATRHVVKEIAEDFTSATGIAVDCRAMGGVDAAKLAREGEPVDLVLLASGPMEKLAAEGHVQAGSLTPIAASGIAVAVPEGAPLPLLTTEADVKSAMLAARRIGYSTGPSGDHLKALWARWGIAEDMSARALQAPPGVPVASLVARGEADLGLQQMSELISQPGIAIAGPLSPECQLVTVFTGGVSTRAVQADAARRFLDFASAPETAALKSRHGMEHP